MGGTAREACYDKNEMGMARGGTGGNPDAHARGYLYSYDGGGQMDIAGHLARAVQHVRHAPDPHCPAPVVTGTHTDPALSFR